MGLSLQFSALDSSEYTGRAGSGMMLFIDNVQGWPQRPELGESDMGSWLLDLQSRIVKHYPG